MTTARASKVLWAISVMLSVASFCPFTYGKVIYVDGDATGANDGSSWANAYTFLQEALADANSAEKPVEIRVAQGIYRPNQGLMAIPDFDWRTATFELINSVTLKGGYAGFGEADSNAREIESYETVLSGDLNGDDTDSRGLRDLPTAPSRRDNSYHVVSGSGTDSTAILDCFIIMSGNADGADSNGYGGGVYNHQGNPRLTNCVFTKNSAIWGGGMCNQDSSPQLINCAFSENWASSHGGGLCNIMSNPTVIDCTFTSNTAFWRGGGIAYITSTATGRGGPIVPSDYVADSESSLHNCVFSDNSAYGGGAISNNLLRIKLFNCVLTGNAANTDRGGAISNYSPGETTLTNCTVSGNRAANYAGGIYGGVRAFINNCIVWANITGKPSGVSEQVQAVYNIDYSCIQGLMDARIEGQGNIALDPCFAAPGYWEPNDTPDDPTDDFWVDGDYHLKSQAGRWDPTSQIWVLDDVSSPCIDAGDPNNPTAFEPFPNGGRVNMGAYGGTYEAAKSPSSVHVKYSGGKGEPIDPYQIATAEDLIALGETPGDYDKHFILTADIDLDPNLPGCKIFDKAVIAPSTGVMEGPIHRTPFSGVFNGHGRKISNLTCHANGQTAMEVGLFGWVADPNAKIVNLGLFNPHVYAEGIFCAGPLVGFLGGNLRNCYVEGGRITGRNDYIGGIVGDNHGRIVDCYGTCTVAGDQNIGGLAGGNSGRITNCYSTGSVSGRGDVGGLVGYNASVIANCYSAGLVNGDENVGGLVGRTIGLGRSHASVEISCFWDMETSGQTQSAGGIGLTTAEMQTASTFLATGWDFVDETANGTDDIWWILEGQSYPRLWWQYGQAFSPLPNDGAIDITQPLLLSWLPGGSSFYHDICIGEGKEEVAKATTDSVDIYRGRQTAEMTTFDPGPLKLAKTYYWRIDEVNDADPNSPWKGKVWHFTTANFIVVDDFESYNDIPVGDEGSNLVYFTWMEGGWNKPLPNVPIGYGPSIESIIVHSGEQSMSFVYDSTVARCSEVIAYTGDLAVPRDWTSFSPESLSLWFYGDPANVPGKLYLMINGIRVDYDGDSDNLTRSTWCRWNVDLTKIATDLENVISLAIGVDGPGATGILFLDDIGLYASAAAE